jgi:transcriptional regulator with XRE-family HTH domain
MIIAERLRSLREEKNLTQGDIETRTGLLRVYISRVENGHTVPSIETLEKIARALEMPLYQLFVGVNERPVLPHIGKHATDRKLWGNSGKDARTLSKFCKVLEQMSEPNRRLLLLTAQRMQRR